MKTNEIRLKDAILLSDGVTRGMGVLFHDIVTRSATDEYDLAFLDVLGTSRLYWTRSANKRISPFLASFISDDAETPVIQAGAYGEIAQAILTEYGDKWDRLNKAVHADYDPLENYSMTEKETPDLHDTRTVKTHVETTSESKINAFNTEDSSPTGDTKTTTEADPSDNIETTGHTGQRVLTRSGNIGVTTSTEMLEQETKARNALNYLRDTVFVDLDEVLCLDIY